MNKLILIAFFVLAQNRDIIIDEPNISLVRSEINYVIDGGCLLETWASNDAGVTPGHSIKPFNGARCNTARTAATKQANLDYQVGDGTQP